VGLVEEATKKIIAKYIKVMKKIERCIKLQIEKAFCKRCAKIECATLKAIKKAVEKCKASIGESFSW